MTLAWPWALLALPAPWLVWRFWPAPLAADRLEHPWLADWVQVSPGSRSRPARSGFWLWLVWGLLVVALARPQSIGPPLIPAQTGRDLMLVVDLSLSMSETDMDWQGQRISRIQAVQAVVGDFVRQRRGDALALVVFGDFAAVQAPLTPDVEAVAGLLATLRPGMAGNSTAIGDGLGLAVQRLRQADSEDAAIILLSDGENTAGELSPDQGAEAARASGIAIHAIGFGGDSQLGVFGLGGSGVDEASLERLARHTGGHYFRARSTAELAAVYRRLDELEPSPGRGLRDRLTREWFWLPAAAALALLVTGQALGLRRRGT